MGYANELATAAIDEAFDAFGVAAVYLPVGGPSVPCVVMLDEYDPERSSDAARSEAKGRVPMNARRLTVRRSEIADISAGSRFQIVSGGESYAVVGAPWRDVKYGGYRLFALVT